MNKFSAETEESLTLISPEELKQINVEKDIKYIVKLKSHEDGFCYAIVFNPSYCDVTRDNTRLIDASQYTILVGENCKYSEQLAAKTIIPNFGN